MKENFFIQNQDSLKKEKIIITGGTEGIGRAISDELLNEGTDIAICARTQENLDAVKGDNEHVFAYQLDLADRHATKKFVHESIDNLGGLDVLILNAAVTGMKDSQNYVFKVNEVAQVALTTASADALRANKGRIVFLSSAAKNIEGAENYGESKRRIEEWLSDFASRPENEGIQIFSVIPGSCDTKMHDEILKYGNGEVKTRTVDIKLKKKLRDPQTVGRIISKMSISGNKFNPETFEYDIKIGQCEVVVISDDNIMAEETNGRKLNFQAA